VLETAKYDRPANQPKGSGIDLARRAMSRGLKAAEILCRDEPPYCIEFKIADTIAMLYHGKTMEKGTSMKEVAPLFRRCRDPITDGDLHQTDANHHR
jgi:hypothetical protein